MSPARSCYEAMAPGASEVLVRAAERDVKEMRIAVNASIFDGRPSGLGAYTRELVVTLSRMNPDLVVYTSHPNELPMGNTILCWGEPSRGVTGHLWRLGWSQISLPMRSALSGADVLLNTVPEGPILHSVPQVTILHDILPLFFPEEFPRQQWYFRSFVPSVLRNSVAVVTDSRQTREDVLARYGLSSSRVITIAPGVDPLRFFPRADASLEAKQFGLSRYLLYVGNLLPHKNLHRLLDAFSLVRGEVVLAIAGYRDPRFWPALARRADALGIASRVRFLDFVRFEALPALYSAALAVVLPSLYEGFGLTILEAMACGAPVVASTTGGLREAAGEAALLVEPLDVAGLAATLQHLVDDPRARASLRDLGLSHAARFRWTETARHLLAVLQRAAAGRTAASMAQTTAHGPMA